MLLDVFEALGSRGRVGVDGCGCVEGHRCTGSKRRARPARDPRGAYGDVRCVGRKSDQHDALTGFPCRDRTSRGRRDGGRSDRDGGRADLTYALDVFGRSTD